MAKITHYKTKNKDR